MRITGLYSQLRVRNIAKRCAALAPRTLLVACAGILVPNSGYLRSHHEISCPQAPMAVKCHVALAVKCNKYPDCREVSKYGEVSEA
jgi:hypothetical protein